MDKISIIVPVYKVEKYLDRCVESLVNQTYKNLEIILVDDGSPDNCPNMCDEWAKKDSRIKVIHKENGGLSDARNAGIEISTGEYIAFVDSDDYLDVNFCKIMLDASKKEEADIVICNYNRFNENENLQSYNETEYEKKIFYGQDIIGLLFNQQAFGLIVMAWAKLYKAEIFKSIRYPKGLIHEDEHVIHRVLGSCKKCVNIDAKLYYYFVREGSITQSKISGKRLDLIKAFEDRIDYINTNFPQFYDKALIQTSLACATAYCDAKKKKASKNIIKAFKDAFNNFYKLTKRKNMKQILFKFAPWLCYIIFKIFK